MKTVDEAKDHDRSANAVADDDDAGGGWWRCVAAAVALGVVVAATLVVLSYQGGLFRDSRPYSQQPSTGSATVPGALMTTATPGDPQVAGQGYIPNDEPVAYDSEVPALSRLDPVVRAALRAAGAAAQADGVQLRVTSGWRSAALQDRLRLDAIENQGLEAANNVVKSPADSAHVRGAAVDVGPTDAALWMQGRGSEFGLCQVYSNEVWHYELIAVDGQCPAMKATAGF